MNNDQPLCFLKTQKKNFIQCYATAVFKLGSISTLFYARFFWQNPLAKKSPSQIVIREKMHNSLSYKKHECNMLMKLTPGVRAHFKAVCLAMPNWYILFSHAFTVQHWVVMFGFVRSWVLNQGSVLRILGSVKIRKVKCCTHLHLFYKN